MAKDYRSTEDKELANEMNALGLPLSFSTTKQKINICVKGKRKGLRAKYVSANNDTENSVRLSKNCLPEELSMSRILQDSTNVPLCSKGAEGDTEVFVHDYKDRDTSVPQSDRDSLSLADAIVGHAGEGQGHNTGGDAIMTNRAEDELSPNNVDVKTNADDLEHAQSSYPGNFLRNDMEDGKLGPHQDEFFYKDVLDSHVGSPDTAYVIGEIKHDAIKKLDSCLPCASADHHVVECPENCSEFGDWRVIWDSFYKTSYFYNIQSQESTWYPPPGLEHFAFYSTVSNSDELSTDAAEEHTGVESACDAIHDIDLHGLHDGDGSLQEKELDIEYLNHSSEGKISNWINDDLPKDFGSVELDKHAIDTITAEQKFSLHMLMDQSTEEPVMNAYGRELREEKKQINSEAACGAPDLPHEFFIDNSLEGNEDNSSPPSTSLVSSPDDLHSYNENGGKKKRKKRVKRLQSQSPLQDIDGGLPPSIVKYWCQRYSLFALFDNGIKMDEEGWFSVTPEPLARHHASRCGSGIIIDCFTGVGGNAIQFANKSNHVIAIDIDPQKIDYARHNASIYGVDDQINFIIGDFFQLAPGLKGDVIFMSPPWGGPDYAKAQAYDIRTMLKPHNGQYLFKVARAISSRVVMFLPRNVDLNQLAELALSVGPPWTLEVEKNYLNGRLKAITAYFDSPVL